MTVYLNGQFLPLEDAKISVLDWGFLHSDATYDTVHVWNGRFFRLAEVDTEAAARLLAGSLLTYAFAEGLFRPDGVPRPPPPDRVAALVRLLIRGMEHQEQG